MGFLALTSTSDALEISCPAQDPPAPVWENLNWNSYEGWFVAKRKGIRLYDSENLDKLAFVEVSEIFTHAAVDPAELKDPKRKAIRFHWQYHAGPNAKCVDYWVDRNDILTANRFVKINRCWPVKALAVESGNYLGQWSFNQSGRGTYFSQPVGKVAAQVYASGGLFIVRDDVGRISAVGRLDQKSGKIVAVEGGEIESQTLFPRSELAGCGSTAK